MPVQQQLEIAVQLVIAMILSMIVGIERERRDKDAGLRTHMLVGVGACLFTALSLVAFPGSETARVAANVATGVGFLGAGVIWRGEEGVNDLTTAASIWVTAALGMTVGVGAPLLAVIVTVICWFILRVLRHFRDFLSPSETPNAKENAS